MKFVILGSLGITDKTGMHHRPRGAKAQTLLAYLLAEGDRSVSMDQLVDELWPHGTAPRTATTAIQVYISKLRRWLNGIDPTLDSGPCILTCANGYQLSLSDHEHDLADFRRMVAQAREAERQGRSWEAAELLREALLLWQGDPLSDVKRGPALERAVQVLREARISACERRIEIELRLGLHTELVGELFSLVGEFPLWEKLYGYLMIALYRHGRTAEALDVYRRLRQRLVEELGMEPGAEVRTLHASVLARDTSLDLMDSLHRAS